SSLAQTKTGTTVGQFLLIEPSARTAAMGNAGVTGMNEAISAYFNPASLGVLQSTDVEFTHSTWLAGIMFDYAAAAVKIGQENTLLLSVTSLNSGEINVRTVNQPMGTGEKYSVTDLALGLGYGQRITDRFSVGLHVKYVQETIWHSTLSAAALDFGTLYDIIPNTLRLGASISNFGTRGKYEGTDLQIRYAPNPDMNGSNNTLPGQALTDSYPLPLLFRVGLGYTLNIGASNQFNIVMDAYHPSDNTESISFGGEWKFMDIFSFRAGYQNLFQQDSEMGLTLGAGIKYDLYKYMFHFDYAWADAGRLGSTQRFTVGLAF
ncbi:MAG: PorV/PorQ family protein, partial [Candidatus Kryptoniota bacterium]